MTCKDCLFYDFCIDCNDFDERGNPIKYNRCEWEECECFKDKSRFVELPCKVGDIVYCFAPCFDTDHHPKLKVVEKEIIELKTIATVFGLNFYIDSIGKTIFLTREEAEKALSDRRKEDEGK